MSTGFPKWQYGFLLLVVLASNSFAANDKRINALIASGEFDSAVSESLKNDSNHYLKKLIQQVRAKKLYTDKTWLVLGHYKKSLLGRNVSQVDSRDYFFSKTGKDNPQAEIEATLAAFFSDRPLEPVKLSAQCRFIARYHWLDQHLQFDSTKLSVEQCDDFTVFMKFVDPEKITVVFPTTHPNSPSSMFGHTLLRLDKKNQTNETRMLNYSINYAAQVDLSVGALSYSMRGLAGGFPGKYSVVPYYAKLREYAQMENRDIWEYTLNIPKDKIDFILMHTYELAPSYFDYYFFSENCSYHLLSLLDLAYPDEQFTKEFSGWTIPIETIRYLSKRGFIEDVSYHPSHAREINARKENMSRDDVALTFSAFEKGLEHIQNEMNLIDLDRQINILDLLNDLFRYDKLKNSEHSANKLNKNERNVLLARSKIKKASKKPTVDLPSIRPDEGHSSTRIGISGSRYYGTNSIELSWRPAYHDLLDPSAGFASHSSLEFMNVTARYDIDKDKLKIHNITVLDIISLEPRKDFFNRFSWRIKLGWKNTPTPLVNNRTYANVGGDVGYSMDDNQDYLIYGFAGALTEYDVGDINEFLISPGLRIGIIAEPIQNWRINTYLKGSESVTGSTSKRFSFHINQSIALSRNMSVRVEVSKKVENSIEHHEGKASLFYYYQ